MKAVLCYIVAKQQVEVRDLLHDSSLERAEITLRPTERRLLYAEFSRRRVWMVYDHKPREEWLLFRRDGKRVTHYGLRCPCLNYHRMKRLTCLSDTCTTGPAPASLACAGNGCSKLDIVKVVTIKERLQSLEVKS
jgi:hypothetical protein